MRSHLDRDEIRTRRGQIHQASDHGFSASRRRNRRSSSAMMSHVVTLPPGLLIRDHDPHDLGIARRGFELVAERRQRIVADRNKTAEVLVQEQSIDIDQRDPRTGRGRMAGDGRRWLSFRPGRRRRAS